MATTYQNKSTAVTASHNANGAAGATKTITMPDTHTTQGARQAAMRTGQQILCQLPSGEQAYFVFDELLSTANNPVLRRV